MYKTIRHGENSLQYTILPQNDDFRIEGKLAGNGNRLAGNASSSTSSSSSTTTTAASTSSTSATSAAAAGAAASNGGHKRSSGAPRKRRTFFAYLGLIFVCTVIIGAVLIPFLVSAECLPSPTEWFLKTKAAFTHSGDRQQHIAPTAATVVPAVPATSLAAAMLGQNVGKTVQIVNRNGVEQFVLKVNKTLPSSTTTTATTTTTTTTTTTAAATTTSTTAAPTIAVVPATEAVASTLPPPPPPPPPVATVATYAPPLSNRLMPATITTRIIQVPLLKSMAKKPIMPPVLAKSNTQQQQESSSNKSNNNNSNNSNNNNWMNTHWAYIDPSTYVQWSGYKAEDSVLLPALLGFALIGMILIITVCLVARNKRTIVSSVRKRNRNPTTTTATIKMAIKPGLGRKTSNKNPPILSHEFVIQNHADIISCVAMVFVVGLMNESTAAFASAFISLHHNVSGEEASREQPNGKPYTYVAGIKDYCAIFFYTLTCIIMHAIIQEFLLDKISKKLHLSKFKLSRFNESGQLVAFYLISFVWGAQIVLREGYLSQVSQLWEGYPAHPMSFLHKFYFIIQLSYYLHMLPELYFQKIKAKEEQQPKIIHSISGFTLIVLAYTLSFQRLALVLLTLHYFSELLVHIFQLIGVFDREERLARVGVVNSACFVLVRFATSVIGVLTLYYGIGGSTDGGSSYKLRALIVLVGLIALQGYLVFSFITEQLRAKREAKREAKLLAAQTKKVKAPNKDKVKRKKESDLPEADQTSPSPVKQKVK